MDAHTNNVTCMRFEEACAGGSGGGWMILASASNNGLVVVHYPAAPTKESMLMLVLNVRSPVQEVSFFGPMRKGLYTLTGIKTMHVYHWDLRQRVCSIGGEAGRLGLHRSLSNTVRLLLTLLQRGWQPRQRRRRWRRICHIGDWDDRGRQFWRG